MKSRRQPHGFFSDLPVKAICLAAAVILFLFHRINTMNERFINVPLDVDVPPGMAIASAYPKTIRITLRGAEESISPILEEDIEASINLNSRKNPGVYRAPVKVTRKGTASNVEPLEIKADPQEITLTLEPLAERRVNLIPDIRGAPAYGYELVQTALAPPVAIIRGAKSRVQGVNALSTEEIDLTGRTASFAAKVKIILPNSLVRVAGEASADFRATIQEAMGSRRFESVDLVAMDLPPSLRLKTVLPSGRMQVQGTQLLVDGVRPDQVKLLLDCSMVRRAGQYTLHPKPETPEGVSPVSWSPRDLIVDFVLAGR